MFLGIILTLSGYKIHFQGLQFVREKEMEIYYRDKSVGTRRVDFFVEGKVMVEIKAIQALQDVHKAQAINYLEASILRMAC